MVESDWSRFQRISRDHLVKANLKVRPKPRPGCCITSRVLNISMDGDHPTSSWQPAPVADYNHVEIPSSPLTFNWNFSCCILCLVSSALLLYTSRSLHLLYKLLLSNWRWQWDPLLNLLLEETQFFQFLLIYCAPAL